MQQQIGRGRAVLAFVAAAILVLTGAVHVIFGWPAMTQAFATTNAPPALVQGLAVPWHFAGLSMISFGVIVALTIRRAMRRPNESLTSVIVIGALYVLFGGLGMAATRGDPTFVMFLVPGVMLVAAAWRSRAP